MHNVTHHALPHALKAAAFDPFGEPAETLSSLAAKPAARRLAQLGAGLFWLLVVVILAARLAYVVPGFNHALDGAAGLLY